MTHKTLIERRLLNQGITSAGHRRPEDVVAWHGAVQGQEYIPARWAVGLRMRDGAAHEDVEHAFEEGRILRTHVMRPTWHLVAPADIRWLLALTGSRIQSAMKNYRRLLELDQRTVVRSTKLVERALRDRQYLTRAELGERLRRSKVDLNGMQLGQVAMYAETECVICSGPRRNNRFTYALVDERAPAAPKLDRDEALGELARRYLRSHAPATLRDFVWWSGLVTADAARGFDICRAVSEEVGGKKYWSLKSQAPSPARDRPAHLLPIYDEYLVAYRDRDAVVYGPASVPVSGSGSVIFQHAIVMGGQVAGTWRTSSRSPGADVTMALLRRLTRIEAAALDDALQRYRRFSA